MFELQIWREKPIRWVNWVGAFPCSDEVSVRRPETVQELAAIVREHKSVRAAATGHSFNFMHCPASTHKAAIVDMRAFRKVSVALGEDGHHAATAEAGVTAGQFQNELLTHGLTLRVPPGNSAFTIGGVLATGVHNLGWSHAHDLEEITLVLHNGTIQTLNVGHSDWLAAAVSLGKLGIILQGTFRVFPYRAINFSPVRLSMEITADNILKKLFEMEAHVKGEEDLGTKLVIFPKSELLVEENWHGTDRKANHTYEAIQPYVNNQIFRLGQRNLFSLGLSKAQEITFILLPQCFLDMQQLVLEQLFLMLHTSSILQPIRKLFGWQHSSEGRGDASIQRSSMKYSWFGWLDELFNFFLGLEHAEVIFPLEPATGARNCLDTILAFGQLSWFRMNLRTMRSENFYLSSVYHAGPSSVFARVDFVVPRMIRQHYESGLTERLRQECPGWRKHWGKALFVTSSDQRWGDAQKFLEVVSRWDPELKFQPEGLPSWLK